MTDGQRLRSVRGLMTLEKFCEPLGVKVSNISAIERDKSGLSVELAKKVALIYNVSLDWLLLGVGSQELGSPPTVTDSSEMISINKDELIELQRLALKNAIAAKERQVENLKNN